MYVFTKLVQFVVFTTKHRSAGAPFHRQPAINWIFTQIKLSSTYRRTFFCLYEASGVSCKSRETQTSKIFSVATDSTAKSKQTCGKSRETLKF